MNGVCVVLVLFWRMQCVQQFLGVSQHIRAWQRNKTTHSTAIIKWTDYWINSRIGSTVQLTAGHNVITGLRQGNNGRKDGIRATGHTESGHFVGPFQLRIARFEDVIGRIAQSRINIAQFAQGKQIGGVFAGFKHVGCGAVEGNTPWGTVTNTVDSVGIGFVATMKSNGIKALASSTGGSAGGVCLGEGARPCC